MKIPHGTTHIDLVNFQPSVRYLRVTDVVKRYDGFVWIRTAYALDDIDESNGIVKVDAKYSEGYQDE
jgi:hypothetical protein